MKVYNRSSLGPVDSREPSSAPPRRAEESSAPAARVDVSHGAQLLRDARGPEAPDPARIERLKEAIRAGTFAVDADRIADAILKAEW